MRRLAVVFAMLVAANIPAFAQRPPDVEAVVDAMFAKNLDQLAKHLPTSLEKRIAELAPLQRKKLERQILFGPRLESEGNKITRVEDSPVLVTLENGAGDKEKRELLLERRISDGYESMLRLNTHSTAQGNDGVETFVIWLRYEEGDWRIREIELPNSERPMRLDDPTLFAEYAESSVSGNESAAVRIMRMYSTAIVAYRSTYPDEGLPRSLDVLGNDGSDEPSTYHAALVYRAWATSPFEFVGYRFEYSREYGEDAAAYTITARPLDVGHTGVRSFFLDESGVVRATSEDREATVDDDPI
jgi:hypothetical protein